MLRSLHRRSILRATFLLAPALLASAAVVSWSAAPSSTAWADQPGQNGAPGQQTVVAESPSVGDIFIGEVERRIISDYYQRHLVAFEQSPEGRDYKKHKNKHGNGNGNGGGNGGGLPPGLAKRGTLPPGLAKQLARNGHLPPGLDYQPLPQDLIVQLPPLHVGYRYTIVDGKVLLVQEASNLIIDAMEVAALEILK